MATIINLKDRDLAEFDRFLSQYGLSREKMQKWIRDDIQPRLEALGLEYDESNPVVRELAILEFELYLAMNEIYLGSGPGDITLGDLKFTAHPLNLARPRISLIASNLSAKVRSNKEYP